MPTRRAVWIVRLVFYPVALALVVVAWQQHRAGAHGADAAVAPARAPLPQLGGLTAEGEMASGRLGGDGRPFALRLAAHFRCTPAIETSDLWAYFYDQRATGGRDAVGGGRLTLRHRGIAMEWDNGWSGRSDLDVDARYSGTRVTGTLRARLRLRAGNLRTRCASGTIPFAMTRRDPPRVVRTNDGEPVSIDLDGDDVRAVVVRSVTSCSDGRLLPSTWTLRPAPGTARLRPGAALTFERRFRPVPGVEEATARLRLADDGAGHVRGRLVQSKVAQIAGAVCTLVREPVTFAVPRETTGH